MNRFLGVSQKGLLLAVFMVFCCVFAVSAQQNQDLSEVLRDTIVTLITTYYMDPIDRDDLHGTTPEELLAGLDPHTRFVSSEDAMAWRRQQQGLYQSIGIAFVIIDGTITVTDVFDGTAAHKSGVLPGDQIIAIDYQSVEGAVEDAWGVYDLLAGEEGSFMFVQVRRPGEDRARTIMVARTMIDVPAAYPVLMWEDDVGYVRFHHFLQGSSEQLIEAFRDLKQQGMKRLIIDLRGNGGGLLSAAREILDEFFPGETLIVTMQGQHASANGEMNTERAATYPRLPVVLLVDEQSASASEIVAGAFQDHDRAYIVGSRTFGKGLVQREFPLGGGAVLSLTIARYYTPSGRLIQTPFDGSDRDAYMEQKRDVDPTAGMPHMTAGGRTVYGGGGITPDTSVALDVPPGVRYLADSGRIFRFAAEYVAQHRATLPLLFEDIGSLDVSGTLDDLVIALQDDAGSAVADGVIPEIDLHAERLHLERYLTAEIARIQWGNSAYTRVLLQDDAQFNEALRHWGDAEAFLSKNN